MKKALNRRSWLRSSALLLGGIGLLPKAITAIDLQTKTTWRPYETDESVLLKAPPTLKARLSANENPFGPSAKAMKAMDEAAPTCYQYPFMHTRTLRQNIADYEHIGPEQILLSAGSSPLLLAAAMHYGKKGRNIVTADPSYKDLTGKAEAFEASIIAVPLTAEYKLDLEAMEAKVNGDTAMVYICNPNNPTGTVVDADALKAFCERVSKKTTVFVDEAYIDYLDDPDKASVIAAVGNNDNIIVARTFSKLYGFAGLRVGYVVATEATVTHLNKYTSGAFSISAPAIGAAIASYQDTDFRQDVINKTEASKSFLYSLLEREGYDYIPSSTNFVMFPLKMDGRRFSEEMMKRGVSIRHWAFNEKHWCRISLGKMEEMEVFAEAFHQLS